MATTISPKLSIGLSYNTTDYSKYLVAPTGTITATATAPAWLPYPPSTITVPFTYTYKLVEQITGEELRKWCESFVADKLAFDA